MLKKRKTLQQTNGWGTFCWHPDGQTLISAQWDGLLSIWDAQSGQRMKTIPSGEETPNLTCSPNGKTIACVGEGYMIRPIKFIDLATETIRQTSGHHEDHLTEITFSPDGTFLASAADDVKLWLAQSGQELQTLAGIYSASFNPSGDTLATIVRGGSGGTHNGQIGVYSVATGEEGLTLVGSFGSISRVAFGPDGDTLASIGSVMSGDSRQVAIWNLTTYKESRILDPGYDVQHVAFSLNRKWLATSGHHFVSRDSEFSSWFSLWDVASGELLQTEGPFSKRPGALAFSPDSRLLATFDGDIVLWEVD